MLQIQNVSIVHTRDLRVLVRDLSFALGDGDKVVIIGEEGDGKSTLLAWIYAPERIASFAEGEGERILGQERLGYLPQALPEAERRDL